MKAKKSAAGRSAGVLGRRAAALALAAVGVCAPRRALADEAARVPLRVRAAGASWEIEPQGGGCGQQADCLLRLPPGKYEFVSGGLHERFELAGPTSLTLHRGSPFWHRVSQYAVAGGLLVGGGALYGAIWVCHGSYEPGPTGELVDGDPCTGGPYAARNRNLSLALYATSGVGFATAFVGAFAYFFTDRWVSVRAAGPRPAERAFAFQLSAAPAPGGGFGQVTLRF